MNHPNATASGASSAVAVLTLAALSAMGVTLSPLVSAALVGAVSSLVLFVGREGLRGLARRVWKGSNNGVS